MLQFDKFGDGPAVLLLHGMGHRRQAWRPVIDRLAEHHTVISVDLPGQGESQDLPAASGKELLDATLAEIVGLCQHLDVVPYLVGNSLGGRLALELGAQGFGRGIVALNPAGFWGPPLEFAYTGALFSAIAAGALGLSPISNAVLGRPVGRALAMSMLMAKPWRLPTSEAVDDLAGFLRAARQPARLFKLASAAAGPLSGVVPPHIPVTIAWSSRDRILLRPQMNAQRAHREIPNAKRLQMPGTGHIPMWDDPDLVADVILAATAGPLRQ